MSDKQETQEDNGEVSNIPSILDRIPELRFSKVIDEKSNLEYEFNDYIFIYYADDKEYQCQHVKVETIKQYINGVALKMLEESKNIYSNIDAPSTFVDNVVNNTDIIIDNVTKGIDKYKPFINELEEDKITLKTKPIVLCVKIGITKTNSVIHKPMLLWLITSHAWKHNDVDPNNFDLINTIELFSE